MRQSGERIGGSFNAETMRVPFDVYKRVLKIFAVDVNSNNTPSPTDILLWKTVVSSSGSSNDLREVMPYMVTAAEDYIGKNTNKSIEVTVGSENERAKRIKGELKVKHSDEDKGVLNSILDVF